jgi:hypothetical protein
LREFEVRLLRRIFGPDREEVLEGWRKDQSYPLFIYSSSFNDALLAYFPKMKVGL